MNEYIVLGEINTLKIDRKTDPGLYLMSQDEESILLPNAYITDNMHIGDNINVFIYTDSEDRIIATTLTPKVMVNQFAVLEVKDIAKFGLFLDWGLPKDLLLPKYQQKSSSKIGDKKVIRVIEDKETDRLIATEKFSKFLSNNTEHFVKNQKVNLIVFGKTELGYKVIVDGEFEGLVYENEIFQTLNTTEQIKGYIKTVREDKKLDISLQPIGKEKSNDRNIEKILEVLKISGNIIEITKKSNPEDIQNIFGISKKAFKRALVTLQERDKVAVNENKITLL
jgi:predicted RNA-binding protein (virulence factor B family)